MIKIRNQIISRDIFQKYFVCDLSSCKGACCVEGDSGAPLLLDEKKIIHKNLEKIKPYMKKEGIRVIEKSGVAILDFENDLTTPLINNRECAFSVLDKGVVKCSIEKAYIDKKINFKKPISCHLFPIRTQKYKQFEAVNYEEIKICKPACGCGSKLKIPLYVFLKDALIRMYGSDWYEELLEVAKQIRT